MSLRAFCLKLVIDDSLCSLYKHVVMLFYIFFLGGGGGLVNSPSRKKRYVTKRGYQIKRYRPLNRGVGGHNAQFFRYVLIEQPLKISLRDLIKSCQQN